MTQIIPFESATLRLDVANERLLRGQQEITLTPKGFALLRHLVKQRGKLVTKQTLLDEIWPNVYVVEEALRYQIKELRAALRDSAQSPQFIETVRGRGYRFIGPITIVDLADRSALDTTSITQNPPAISSVPPGRAEEMEQLHQWLIEANLGQRQLGFISGEPGIGKTTLLNAFLAGLNADIKQYHIASGRCVELYGLNEAYLPLLDTLEQLCQSDEGNNVISDLDKYAPSWLLQLPEFVTDREGLERRVQGSGRERMLREFAQLLEALSTTKTVVLCLEDLHWADSATLEQLAYLAQRTQSARLLILGSYRPVDAYANNQALIKLLAELQRHTHCSKQPLSLLDESAISRFLETHYPGLPATTSSLLQQRCGGNPLFMHNIIDYLQERRLIIENNGQWQFQDQLTVIESELPQAVRQLIERRFEQLDADDQQLLLVASAVGFDVTAEALAAGLGKEIEIVEERCTRLVQRDLFLRSSHEEQWPDGSLTAKYEFIHALYQETLHQRLTPTQRKRSHQKIGERLESGYEGKTELIAAELAYHFEQSYDYERAVRYFAQAAEQANQRYAYQETVSAIETALQLLKELPADQDHAKQEIALLYLLAGTLIGDGFVDPRIKQAYVRARELCQRWQEYDQEFHIVRGSAMFYLVRAEFNDAQTIARQCLQLAQQSENSAHLMEAGHAMGSVFAHSGEFKTARFHFEQSIKLFDRKEHHNHVVLYGFDTNAVNLSGVSEVLWLLGYPQQAVERSRESLLLAQKLTHPPTEVLTLEQSIRVHIRRRESAVVLDYANTQLKLSKEYGLNYWEDIAMAWIYWALAVQGQIAQNLEPMWRTVIKSTSAGGQVLLPMCQGLSAELHDRISKTDTGLEIISSAIKTVEKTGERWYEAELYRLQGALLLNQGKSDAASQAETSFQKSLSVAQNQEAKSWELRTATSLARLWEEKGKSAAAYGLLAPIYDWFTEGFDTVDLQEAKSLLEKLP